MPVSSMFGGQVACFGIGLVRSHWLNVHKWMESVRCTLRDYLSISFCPGGIQFRHSEITSRCKPKQVETIEKFASDLLMQTKTLM